MKHVAFRLADWEIRPATNSIYKDGERRQMEPRAMDVLVVLCDRANTVVSAEALLQECWGSTLHGDNPVHKTIAQLRSILGDNTKSPIYIETIRKRGYRTIAEVVVVDIDDAASAPVASWPNGSPFRGLQAFIEEHSTIFFGRSDATLKLVQSVSFRVKAKHALILLLGPSGSGKTSLVRAGLLPSLMHSCDRNDGIHVLSATSFDLVEMGEQYLFTALAGALLDLQIDGSDVFLGSSAVSLGQRLMQDFESVTVQLRDALLHLPKYPTSSRVRIALFVDRFEALFALPHITEQERRAFLAVLDALARNNHVIVIVACRNDFYPRIAEYPLLMSGKAHGGHVDLNPPSHAEITQMIRLPATAANLSFGVDPQSQARLDDILCASAVGSPDALPLLQYTLQELYRLRTDSGELSFEAFRHLGGVEGAIGHRAEEVVNALTERQRASLPRVLSLLVRLSENEELVTSRRAPWTALHTDVERELVNALVDTRLLVSELVGDEAGFGVAHEALLRRWPRVTGWIETHRHALHVRGRITALTLRWVAEGRVTDLLLPRGKQLNEASTLLNMPEFSLSADEIALIHASAKKAALRGRIRIGAMALIICLSLLATGLGVSALSAKQVAQKRRAEAEGLMGFMLGDFADKLRPLARLDLLDSVSAKALDYLSSSKSDELSAASLTQRAKALQVIGEVSIARGNPKAAIDALADAHTILLRQLATAPKNTDVLKNLGVNSFWLGQIHLDQSDWDRAEHFFESYRDYSDRLHDVEPENADAWVEQSYAHSALGALALKRGQSQAAILEFRMSIDLKTRALESKPQDRTLTADLANSLSWEATTWEALGELDTAMPLYVREFVVVRKLHDAFPGDSLWTNRVAVALQHRAGLELVRGDDEAALDDYRMAKELYDVIIKQEPSNREWQGNRVVIELGELRIMLHQAPAKEILPKLLAMAKKTAFLTKLDPNNAKWSRLNALSHQTTASVFLKLYRTQDARKQIEESVLLLENLHVRNQSDLGTRKALANTRLVSSYVEAASGNLGASQDACKKARDLVHAEATHSTDFQILDPWVRAHVCLGQKELVMNDISRLAKMGYRPVEYINYISNRK